MSIQFSLFDDDATINFYRDLQEKEKNKYLEEIKAANERAEAARNATLFDYVEIDKILKSRTHQSQCENRSVSHHPPIPRISDEVRFSILRSFTVLYLWDFCGGSQDKIDVWLRTPQKMFNGYTPEQSALFCWHCTRAWMKQMKKSLGKGTINDRH